MKKIALFIFGLVFNLGYAAMAETHLTIATFNVSMESENYVAKGQPLGPQVLSELLQQGRHPQISNIAAIIQQVQPDIILLNEFDYIADPAKGVQLFLQNYLAKSQQGGTPIQYPYFYLNTVNTGQPSGFDLNQDGKINTPGEDAWGFGHYPGQYGMVVLSKYPLQQDKIRTFQHFKWLDMPGYRQTKKTDGSPWYSAAAFKQMPLSSKSHWDIPIQINGKTLHLLASHPTPPVFDGPEDRNGNRNHDEVRFWLDYISGQGSYIYDDQGKKGGLAKDVSFVIAGDLNSSPDEGDAFREAITQLVHHPLIHQVTPTSKGGALHSANNPFAATHTASWRMRADYVLAAKVGLKPIDSGVFWPQPGEPLHAVVASRGASSDHRLVWVKLKLE